MVRQMTPRLLALLALAVAALGCASSRPTEPTPDGARERAIFEEILDALGRKGGAAGLDVDVLDRQNARFAEVVAWHEAGELTSAAQRFWAGAALVRSDEPEHLVLAEALGHAAAAQGERRGRLVEAEARDRMALILGEAQPYGTQMVYEPLLGRWRLYAVDPKTTDEERRAMGLPSLEELRARAAARNDTELTQRLRDELIRPSGLTRR